MKVSIIGGGPGGLYFALLAKKQWPEWDITVLERNRPDDTFGFGVVFSDETLGTFREYDRASYEAIRRAFAYWGDVDVVYKGHVIRCGGNGFCGCSRVTLLGLLQKRCAELGVNMQFRHEAAGIEEFGDSDLIVAADGINSRVRETHRAHFRPSVDLRPNKFTWLGSTKPLDAFKYFFRETPHGIVLAHCYQYEKGASTWVIETGADTWEKFGFDTMTEDEMLPVIERVFAEELAGHKLIANRSLWRNFPTIRNETWVMGKVVLIGDAKATAHFSIGSGTKLAMEDAIALFESFRAKGAVAEALAHFDTALSIDPRLARALLQNLIGNAWKFTQKTGTPRIEFGVGPESAFCVRDNGAGFDMAYKDKLFGAFQRLHSPDEFPGTGIGLATAQRIVRRHGGQIWAEGAIGTGACFHFTLQPR